MKLELDRSEVETVKDALGQVIFDGFDSEDNVALYEKVVKALGEDND